MTSLFLKPSDFKSLQKLTRNEHYRLKNFIGNGNFSRKVILEDVFTKHEMVGKVVTAHNEGEFCHWPTLWHKNLSPLLEMISINDEMTIFLCPTIGKNLKIVIEETNFMQHPKCFDRKKSYAKDILHGLEYLHQQSLYLLNLHDENVLICCRSDKAMINDFSYTVSCKTVTKSKISCLQGTPLPPESVLITGHEIVECMPVDMWLCGVMFLHMFTRHVLPWCHLAVDLLNGLEIELLRQTNVGSYLDDDCAMILREFLKQFLEPVPKLRVTAEIAVSSPFVNIESNRLDKARDFWKASELSRFSPNIQAKIDRKQKEFEILRDTIFQESTSASLSRSRKLKSKSFEHLLNSQIKSRINAKEYARQEADCLSMPESVCLPLNENTFAANTVKDIRSSNSKTRFQTFSSDFNLKENIIFTPDQNIKSNTANKSICTSSEPNLSRIENQIISNGPVPSSLNVARDKECPCRLSGMSCSNEIFENVSLEECDRVLVLPNLVNKIRKNNSPSIFLSKMAEKGISERLHQEQFQHKDSQGLKTESSCTIYNGLKPIQNVMREHEVRNEFDRLDSQWCDFNYPFDDIPLSAKASSKKNRKNKRKNKTKAKSVTKGKEMSKLPTQDDVVDIPMGVPLCADVGCSSKCKRERRSKSKRRLIRCLCPGSKFEKTSQCKMKKTQNTPHNSNE